MSEPSSAPDSSPPIAHAEAKAAGLLLLTLLLIGGFVYYVMLSRGVFEETQRLVLVAENTEGVTVGMDLGFAGFPIGRVTRIELGDDGKAHLHVAVPLRDARWLRTSSVFTLERGVVGGARLRAFTGILDDPPLPDGARRDVLIGDASSGVPELMATVNRLIGNLERLTTEQSALAKSLLEVRRFTAALNGRHGALGALLGNERDAAKIGEALEQTRQLLLKADAALADVKAITADTRSATADLDALRAEIDLNLHKVSGMVDDLNRKWPLARQRELGLP